MQAEPPLWGNRHPILFFLVVLPLLAVVAFIGRLLELLFSKPAVRSSAEVAGTLEAFINDSGGSYDWDDFVCGGRIADPELEAVRARCASLPDDFPPIVHGHYCSDAGFEVMRGLAAQLRARPN